MDWLNYHHLLYFWTVAREGSIARAAKELRLAPPTVHAQIRTLEQFLGQQLLVRRGRGLVLTDAGRVVMGYADEIFSVGAELANLVRGNQSSGPRTLTVGIVSSMPKLIAERIIAPALMGEDVKRASPEFVRENTGFAIGGVPPVGRNGWSVSLPAVFAAA